mgnify:CR=1 FL=1
MWSNSDRFDHLIALAATKCTDEEARQLNELDTSSVEFDSSYYKKRSQMIRKYRHGAKKVSLKVIAVRAVAAVMIVAVMLAILISCVPELRKAIYNAIIEWYDDFFAVRYEGNDGLEQETGYNGGSMSKSSTWADAPTYIASVRKPTDLPEGVWEKVVSKTSAKINLDYYLGEEYLFSFSQFILEPSDKCVDSEEIDVSYVKINGNDATIVEYIAQSEICVFWNDKEYTYQIVSDVVGINELLKYAESVK